MGNNELGSLLINYIKCNGIRNGIGHGIDFFKNDELNKKLFVYLAKVNTQIGISFFDDRKFAEKMFDEALKKA